MRQIKFQGLGGLLPMVLLWILIAGAAGLISVVAPRHPSATDFVQQRTFPVQAVAGHAPMADQRDSDDAPSRSNNAEFADTIESILHTQQEAWNNGDLGKFMQFYWPSDKLTFSSKGTTTRGWPAIRDAYQQNYPTRETMGRLAFDHLEVTPLGSSAALVLGHWQLQRESNPIQGNFTLIFRKIGSRWLIVHDHTSASAE